MTEKPPYHSKPCICDPPQLAEPPKEGVDYYIEEEYEVDFCATSTVRVWESDLEYGFDYDLFKKSDYDLDAMKKRTGEGRRVGEDGKPFDEDEWRDGIEIRCTGLPPPMPWEIERPENEMKIVDFGVKV